MHVEGILDTHDHFGGDLMLEDFLGQFFLGRLGLHRRRLINSDRPCNPSRMKPMGTRAYTGQRIRPPAFCDISPLWKAWITSGQIS